MPCFLPESNLKSDFTYRCLHSLSSSYILPRRLRPLSILNTIRILIGCSVLNLLYQLNLSLVEICFIYTLKVTQGGRMFMSIPSLRLQIVNELPDSPKMEAKGALLVRGP